MSVIEWRYLWIMNYLLNKDRAEATVKKYILLIYTTHSCCKSFIHKIKAPLRSHDAGEL